MKLDPMLCRSLEILYCIPCTSDTTAITDATPIITPKTVRIERILLAPIARRAILRFSTNIVRCRVPRAACRVTSARLIPAIFESRRSLAQFSLAMTGELRRPGRPDRTRRRVESGPHRAMPSRLLAGKGTQDFDFDRNLRRCSTSLREQHSEFGSSSRNLVQMAAQTSTDRRGLSVRGLFGNLSNLRSE